MHRAGNPRGRVCCLHCGSSDAVQWRSGADTARFVCPTCGSYKISDEVARLLPEPVMHLRSGWLEQGADGERWLIAVTKSA